ncbi:hypothetical protein ABW20_dc0101368 [Dactylellina cionopaga]|nr:hypothetical protein ABW20_dc0101368 [Dactylellina cionopaga]
MSDTGSSSSSLTDQSTTQPTGPESTTTTEIPSTTPPTSIPVESSTSTTEQPPTSTTETPPETTSTTSVPESTTTPATTSTTEPPSSTSIESSTTSDESTTTEPESTTSPPVTIITVTPSVSGDTTVTITTTSVNTDSSSTGLPDSSSQLSSSASTSSTSSATSLPSSGGGGLSQPAKIAIAIIIPIFAVILIAFLGIFFWRRYKKRKDSEEMRRKEVEEYGYNPNNDVSGAGNAVLGAGNVGHHGGDMAESEAGYRGWGNTAGGRKPSAPLSTGAPTTTTNTTGTNYGNTPYSDSGIGAKPQYMPSPSQPELYGSPVAAGAVPVATGTAGVAALGLAQLDEDTKQNRDRNSHSPLLSSPTQRPSTADSSTIGAAAETGPSELDDGLQRGDSVASSRYTNATRHSEGSDALAVSNNNTYMNNYTSDGNDYYNDVANPYSGDYDHHEHAPDQGYHQSPPMIQQVGARRNTRIENPSDHHYAQMPRQGNSGIAQNF